MQLYQPLAALSTAHTIPDTANTPSIAPRVITRLPVLPDASRPPSPERLLLAHDKEEQGPDAGRRSAQPRLATTMLGSRQERLALIYATAHSTGKTAEATAASVGSNVIIHGDSPAKFRHMDRIRRNSVDVAAATMAAAAAAGDASTTGTGSARVPTTATQTAEAIAKLVRLDANKLRYQSPLEKAHDEIVNAWDRRAARAIDDIVRRTHDQDLEGPHSILPSYWPATLPRQAARRDDDDDAERAGWRPVNTGLVPTMISSPRTRRARSPADAAAVTARASGRPPSRSQSVASAVASVRSAHGGTGRLGTAASRRATSREASPWTLHVGPSRL